MLPALLAALLTLAVLITGGVATTAASLATPGDALSFSLLHWQAGEFLGAAMIALFAWIALVRPKLRQLSGALCIGTALQGLPALMPLEGTVGMIHSSLAQALFAGAIALVVAASPAWSRPPQLMPDYGWPSLRSLSITLPVLIAVQVGLGAAFRHRLLGLMPHVIGAMLVSIFILIVGSFALQQCKDHKLLAGSARVLMVVTFVQVFLGLTVFTVRSMPQQVNTAILVAATAHVVTGAAVLGASVVLGMHIRRNVTPKN